MAKDAVGWTHFKTTLILGKINLFSKVVFHANTSRHGNVWLGQKHFSFACDAMLGCTWARWMDAIWRWQAPRKPDTLVRYLTKRNPLRKHVKTFRTLRLPITLELPQVGLRTTHVLLFWPPQKIQLWPRHRWRCDANEALECIAPQWWTRTWRVFLLWPTHFRHSCNISIVKCEILLALKIRKSVLARKFKVVFSGFDSRIFFFKRKQKSVDLEN